MYLCWLLGFEFSARTLTVFCSARRALQNVHGALARRGRTEAASGRQPPDRVGIYRTLKLGASLLPTGDGGHQLNVTESNAHKTASIFGMTRTTMPRAISLRINAYIQAANLQAGDYLFYAGTDASKPLHPSSWTYLVKSCFKRHSVGHVPLAPKELRSAFITHLKSQECGADSEVLKAAATAMRHSSKTQSSAAYDKNENDKSIAAAARFAETYAARFSKAASSSAARGSTAAAS